MRLLILATRASAACALGNGLQENGLVADLAANLETADRHLHTETYDLLVLDLTADAAKTLIMLARWREQGISAFVLALLPASARREGPRVLDRGADDYLVSPFCWEELRARVCALLRRCCGTSDRILRVHDLEINTSVRAVKRGGQLILLTRREYDLLECLARHPGRVLSRTSIWEHLAPGHGRTASNVVDVYIRYLRTKIDKGFDLPLILTRRGHGYLMRDEGDGG